MLEALFFKLGEILCLCLSINFILINPFQALFISAPVERLFSVLVNVFRPDRYRLKDSAFEKLMFIKCNKQLSKDYSFSKCCQQTTTLPVKMLNTVHVNSSPCMKPYTCTCTCKFLSLYETLHKYM